MKKHLLIDETPLIVLPSLAAFVGVNEAIAIQQVHWVCRIKAEHEDWRTFHDGEMWCCYTVDQWLQKMPWLKERTCRRMLTGLEERKILIATKPYAKDWNHTKWYRIDYAVLDKMDDSIYKNCQIDVDKMAGSKRTKWPIQDVDKMADSSISKKDHRKKKDQTDAEKCDEREFEEWLKVKFENDPTVRSPTALIKHILKKGSDCPEYREWQSEINPDPVDLTMYAHLIGE